MPKYYFDVNESGIPNADEGYAFPDDDAAWHEATLVAGEMFRDVDGAFKPGQEWKLEVTDEHHRPLYVIKITAKALR